MVTRTSTRDEGFSLTELIVVMALLGVILMISYGGLQAVYASRDVSDRQARFSIEVSAPLNAMEEVVSQALSVETATDYSLTVLTDADNDDIIERNIIECTTDGRVVQQRWITDANRTNVNLRLDADWAWSNSNVNRADSVPMFTYFDKNGAEIADPANYASDAKVVEIRLKALVDDRTHQDSRTVLMRNR